MTADPTLTTQGDQKSRMMRRGGGGGADAFYGIGLFGAWAYYLKRASTPQERIQGFFKGFFWPAFLVYKLFEFLEDK